MPLRKKLNELFNKDIEDLKYYRKVKRVNHIEKDKIKIFADNSRYEIYCCEDGKIYIKSYDEIYLYEGNEDLIKNDEENDLNDIIDKRKKFLSNKKILGLENE